MRHAQAGERIAPIRRDLACRVEDEVPLSKLWVGDDEVICGVGTGAPQHDVEVQHASRPSHSSCPAAEEPFDPLESCKHPLGL